MGPRTGVRPGKTLPTCGTIVPSNDNLLSRGRTVGRRPSVSDKCREVHADRVRYSFARRSHTCGGLNDNSGPKLDVETVFGRHTGNLFSGPERLGV